MEWRVAEVIAQRTVELAESISWIDGNQVEPNEILEGMAGDLLSEEEAGAIADIIAR